MKIVMTETRRVAPDGIHDSIFFAGQVYDLPNELAMMLIKYGWAKEMKAIKEVPEKKNRIFRRK